MIKKVRQAITYRRFVRSLITPGPDEVVYGYGRGIDEWDTMNHLWICGRCGDAEYDIDTRLEASGRAADHAAIHDGVKTREGNRP